MGSSVGIEHLDGQCAEQADRVELGLGPIPITQTLGRHGPDRLSDEQHRHAERLGHLDRRLRMPLTVERSAGEAAVQRGADVQADSSGWIDARDRAALPRPTRRARDSRRSSRRHLRSGCRWRRCAPVGRRTSPPLRRARTWLRTDRPRSTERFLRPAGDDAVDPSRSTARLHVPRSPPRQPTRRGRSATAATCSSSAATASSGPMVAEARCHARLSASATTCASAAFAARIAPGPTASRMAVRISGWVTSTASGVERTMPATSPAARPALPSTNRLDGIVDVAGGGVDAPRRRRPSLACRARRAR